MKPGAARSRRTRQLLTLLVLALAGVSLQRLLCATAAPPVQEFAGASMGTRYVVKLAVAPLAPAARARIAQTIEARLERVSQLMSTYEPESELSRFNRHEVGTPFRVSRETLEVFRAARAVSELSAGAFDVTVEPLVAAWGFGAAERTPSPPAEAELARLRDLVGFRLIEIDPTASSLRKRRPGTRCDLSAIAKGYAVDRVAEGLLELGYEHFLVELGGDLRAHGRKQDDTPWRVAIESPDPGRRSLSELIELQDLSLATSGDYRNFYEREGVWISHLIDPRTGRPIEHGLASVSVIHPRAIYADALATALIVLGPGAGYALAADQGLPAFFVLRDPEGRLRSRGTPAFQALRSGGGEAPATAPEDG